MQPDSSLWGTALSAAFLIALIFGPAALCSSDRLRVWRDRRRYR